MCEYIHGYYCTAPDTECPHWIGTFCEFDEEQIDIQALEKYLKANCKEKENNYGNI